MRIKKVFENSEKSRLFNAIEEGITRSNLDYIDLGVSIMNGNSAK